MLRLNMNLKNNCRIGRDLVNKIMKDGYVCVSFIQYLISHDIGVKSCSLYHLNEFLSGVYDYDCDENSPEFIKRMLAYDDELTELLFLDSLRKKEA